MPNGRVTTWLEYETPWETCWEIEVTGTVRETQEFFGADRDGRRGDWERHLEVSDVEMEFTQRDEPVPDEIYTALEQEATAALMDRWDGQGKYRRQEFTEF